MSNMPAKVLCVYHAACADGLGAAWAVHRALGENAEFVAAKYGVLPPFCNLHFPRGSETELDASPLRGRDILIVDFSYPLPVLRAMAQEARSVLVIDHHKTAREDLVELPTCKDVPFWIKSYKNPNGAAPTAGGGRTNLAAIFDLERSGAGLTWDYLHPLPSANAYRSVAEVGVKGRPHIIDLIEDRDLWRFRFADETRAFHAVLTSYDTGDLPASFNRLDNWNTYSQDPELWARQLSGGHAILRAQSAAVASAVAASRRTIRIAGHIVPCANVPGSMASDAGHLLCSQLVYVGDSDSGQLDEPPFSTTYYDGTDGKRHFSLRSPEGGADVGHIAKAMAEKFNAFADLAPTERTLGFGNSEYGGHSWTGGGHEHAAGFDAPLGWDGE